MHKAFHIITRLDMGGSAQNTLLTCMRLALEYDTVMVHGLSLESKMAEDEWQALQDFKNEAAAAGVRFVSVAALVRRIDPLKDFRAFLFLLRLMRRERPALVHTHSSKAGILGRLAARLAGVPIVVHTPHGHVFQGHFGRVVSAIFLWIERLFDKLTDCVIALTEGEKRDYVTLSVSKPEKIHVIHSGVAIDRFKAVRLDIAGFKRQLGIAGRGAVVGTVGWLLPIKGPEHLLRAMIPLWRKGVDAVLVFVGKGELEEALQAEAAEFGVSDRVFFLGWRRDIEDIMQVFDIFVLPSMNEGMGRVLVEAMAVGKPVVASNVGGVPDLVKHNFNGFLAEPGDSRGLSLHIEKLLRDDRLRDEMGRRGRQVSENYSVQKMLAGIDRLYLTLFQNSAM